MPSCQRVHLEPHVWLDAQSRGTIQHPMTLLIASFKTLAAPRAPRCDALTNEIGSIMKHSIHTLTEPAGLQDFSACLGLLGPALDVLSLHDCEGQLITSDSMRTLWTCPRVRSFTINDCCLELDAEDLEGGLQHFRFAPTIPLSSHRNPPVKGALLSWLKD